MSQIALFTDHRSLITDPSKPVAANSITTWLLRIVCAVMFAGHGWVCWNGDMPLRALLWDEELVSGAVKSLTGMDWGEWVSSMRVDDGINVAIRVQAWIFYAFAAAVLLPVRHLALGVVYFIATLNLAFLAWLKYHDAGVGIGQGLEHLSQVAMPLALFLLVRGNRRSAIAVAMVAIAVTYVGHGLFAIDLPSQTIWLNHPRPGNFTEMTMLCFGLETEPPAVRILVAAGIVDIVAAVLIFAGRWPRSTGLLWMTMWGFLTALARPWAYFEPTAAAETLDRWVPEALYRAPHFGLPLFLLLALRRRRADLRDPQP